jgi:hypothetical protein
MASHHQSVRSLSIRQKRKNGNLCLWRLVAVATFVMAVITIASILIYFLAVSDCETPDSLSTVTVKQGKTFTIIHQSQEMVKYCSVKSPSSILEPDRRYSVMLNETNDVLSVYNERVKILVSGKRCYIIVEKAMRKDSGQWEFFVEIGTEYLKQNRRLYNVSVIGDQIPRNKSQAGYFERHAKFSTTAKMKSFSSTTQVYYPQLSTSTTRIYYPQSSLLTTQFYSPLLPMLPFFSTKKTSTSYTADQICPNEWREFSGNCYKLFENSIYVEREEASRVCYGASSNLSSILSSEEQLFISKYASAQNPNKKVWVGGRQNSFHIWKWDENNEKEFNYTNWHLVEPDSGMNCMYLNHLTNYSWHDASCGTAGKRWGISLLLCKKSFQQ